MVCVDICCLLRVDCCGMMFTGRCVLVGFWCVMCVCCLLTFWDDARCLLFVVCCVLAAACRLSFNGCSSVCAAGCKLLVVAVCCLVIDVRCLLCIVCCVSFVVRSVFFLPFLMHWCAA